MAIPHSLLHPDHPPAPPRIESQKAEKGEPRTRPSLARCTSKMNHTERQQKGCRTHVDINIHVRLYDRDAVDDESWPSQRVSRRGCHKYTLNRARNHLLLSLLASPSYRRLLLAFCFPPRASRSLPRSHSVIGQLLIRRDVRKGESRRQPRHADTHRHSGTPDADAS